MTSKSESLHFGLILCLTVQLIWSPALIAQPARVDRTEPAQARGGQATQVDWEAQPKNIGTARALPWGSLEEVPTRVRRGPVGVPVVPAGSQDETLAAAPPAPATVTGGGHRWRWLALGVVALGSAVFLLQGSGGHGGTRATGAVFVDLEVP